MMHGSMAFMMIFMWLFWLLIIGGVILAIVLAARALRQSERNTPSATPFVAVPDPSPTAVVQTVPSTPSVPAQLGMLDEDLRRLYDLLQQRGGEAPQGDLVALTGWSKAKVSKALDRLERKGLVVRVRRGMSNRVIASGAKAVS